MKSRLQSGKGGGEEKTYDVIGNISKEPALSGLRNHHHLAASNFGPLLELVERRAGSILAVLGSTASAQRIKRPRAQTVHLKLDRLSVDVDDVSPDVDADGADEGVRRRQVQKLVEQAGLAHAGIANLIQ